MSNADEGQAMIVTIDGPAGAGKSTVAKALARRLGFRFLDTGAMYRAAALAALRRGVDWDRPDEVAQLVAGIRIELVGDRTLLDGQDVSEAIRTQQVTAATRFTADNPRIRRQMVQLQRAMAAGQNVVTEGRDQGTLAFPDAQCKVYLTASPAERARRRLEELLARGDVATLEQVLAAQEARDKRDAGRPLGAMAPAEDAVEVDTEGLTVAEVVQRLAELVRARQAARSPGEADR